MKDFALKLIIGFGAGLMISNLGFAAQYPRGPEGLQKEVERLLTQTFPNSKVVILPTSKLPSLRAREEVMHADLGRIVPNGTTDVFVTTGGGRLLVGQVEYEARTPAFVSVRRIMPGEHLSKDDFQVQEVNVAKGLNFEYRGLIVSTDTPIDQYETKQTILEGQYPLRTGIQRVPDVKRGDVVQVKLISGEIQLATSAQAQEPGYLNAPIRVLTMRTKKELQGVVKARGLVEVEL